MLTAPCVPSVRVAIQHRAVIRYGVRPNLNISSAQACRTASRVAVPVPSTNPARFGHMAMRLGWACRRRVETRAVEVIAEVTMSMVPVEFKPANVVRISAVRVAALIEGNYGRAARARWSHVHVSDVILATMTRDS